jgi:8-oxo-dGTP pyrophosphatase MutT (NUDIX family)
LPVKLNSSNTIYTGRVYQLIRENITLPNRFTLDVDVIRHPGAAAIVALSDKKEIIMVRQYRHAVGDFIWEIPAGTLDPNENHLNCAKRELAEETGFSGKSWNKLGEIVPVPAYSDERILIYLTTELYEVGRHPEQDEYLSVHMISFDHVLSMIYKGDIYDAKTISGIFLAGKALGIGFAGVNVAPIA